MRLIDADRLETIMSETVMVIIRNPIMDNQEAYVRAAFDAFGKMIHNAPVINAVPVVHGKWTMGRYNGLSYCSICGTVTPVMDAYGEDCICPNYCPNCGASMRGGKDDAVN